jgi:hypothetical protein
MNSGVCSLCGKKIKLDDAVKYEQMRFDTDWCLETFKKLKAGFGDALQW